MARVGSYFPFALTLVLCACGSTTVLSSWRDPGTSQVPLRKLLVLAPAHDVSLRHAAEDELVKRMKSVEAVPSYTLIPDAVLDDNDAIRARAKAGGFDGVVVMRVVSVEKDATWVPGTVVGPYYAFGRWPAYDPGYVRVDTYVRVETNIYSVPDDRLIWASASRTANPRSLRALVASSSDAITKEMSKQGFLR